MNIVTHKVLFTRRNNENADSAMDAVRVYDESKDAELLTKSGTFCANWDNNMPVAAKLYDVKEVRLPEFLTVEAWLSNFVAWKFTWGAGVDPTWSEEWQRGLMSIPSYVDRAACVDLLKVKKFRSEFRKGLRDQLVKWLETPVNQRQYKSPFSPKQYDCLVNKFNAREYKACEEDLYRSNRYFENLGAPVRV